MLGLVLLGMAVFDARNTYYPAIFEGLSAVVIVSLIMLIIGYGFLSGRRWCFYLSIVLILLLALNQSFNAVEGNRIDWAWAILSLIVLYFLNRPSIRIWFGIRPGKA